MSLDGKNSNIRDLKIKLFGLQAGYLYNKRTNVYIGFYSSYNKSNIIVENPTSITPKVDSNTVYENHQITYFNIGCEYYFYNSNKWRFSIPVALGLGVGNSKRFQTSSTKTTILSDKSSGIMPLDFGLTANYKITWWLWAGAGLGTRITFGASRYSAPYYSIGLSIRTGEIYNRAKKWYRERN